MALRVFSTLAVAVLLRRVLPSDVETVLEPTAALLRRIVAGERADVAILTAEGVERLLAEGVLRADTRRDLVRSAIGLAVPAGAAHPRIGSVDELRAALLAAPSLVYSRAGASGIFFAELLERLGITAEVNAKATVIPQGFTAEVVARREAALAIQQVSELMAVPGVEVVGPLPEGANTRAVFSAALFAGARPGAAALLNDIAAALTPEALRAAGLEPVAG
jgi:molybdate transport system substrate-binding protein